MSDEDRTEKGYVESGVPARSKQKSEEEVRSQKSEVKSLVYVV
jgi:hypothetical protein